jgi:hypothetical protein
MKPSRIIIPSVVALALVVGCAKGRSSPATPDAGEDAGPPEPPPTFSDGGDDPCNEVNSNHSYIGCDAWPTPVANVVWSVFDFAAVVGNPNDSPAHVTVERGGKVVATADVEPNGLAKIYLPWVPELKGKDADYCGAVVSPLPKTVRVNGGGYHLMSNRPVTVYQFNALEYAPVGGPAKKDWTDCPGDIAACGIGQQSAGCFSYSNDASILFPSAALTGTYRVTGIYGSDTGGNPYIAITATRDGTNVTVHLSPTAEIVGGGGIPNTLPGGTVTFSMNAGDVVELAAPLGSASDLSGSLVTADHPIQVISGHPCTNMPESIQACDHVEQSVLPAETLGKHYLVVQPTGPSGSVPGHVVRMYGNVDGTHLTYSDDAPKNAPTTLDAGQVVTLGVVDKDFEVKGDHEFAVSTFMLGGQAVDPGGGEGDPSMSTIVAVEQYRNKYVFLAPDDYDMSFVDAYQPMDAVLTLDGKPVDEKPTALGKSGFGVARIRLKDAANHGTHVLESQAAFGIQVIGYGLYTSYMYPGGLDLNRIAPAPPK